MMEKEDLEQSTTQEPNITAPQQNVTGEGSPVAEPGEALPQESTAMEKLPMGERSVASPTHKKHLRGIVALVTVALLVVCASAYALVFQSPQRVILRAISKGFSQAQSLEKLEQKLPMLAKSTQLAKSGNKRELELTLNSLDIPGINSLLNMLFTGASIKGFTVTDPATHTQEGSYQLALMGKKLGTLDHYASPTLLALGVQEYCASPYLLDMERLPVEGPSSYLFSGFEPDMLQAMSDSYRAARSTPASITPAEAASMTRKLGELFAKGLVNAQFGTLKEEGRTYYTAILPAADTKLLVESLYRYLYLESPLTASQPDVVRTRAELALEELLKQLPDAPAAAKLELQRGRIAWLQLSSENALAADSNAPQLELTVDLRESPASKAALLMSYGKGTEKTSLELTAEATQGETDLGLNLLMKMEAGGDAMALKFNGTLDGATAHNNLNVQSVLTIDGTREAPGLELTMEGKGDFYAEEDRLIFSLPDFNMEIQSNEQKLSCNLGVQLTTTPDASTLSQPTGTDLLTVGEAELNNLYTEVDAAVATVVQLFLGSLQLAP